MSLDSLRAEIDELDREIVKLFNRRARAAKEIGALKAENSGASYDPTRERCVYEALGKANDGPLPDSALRSIWREVMSASLALQQPVRVAYFGPAGTFTHQAARAKFGSSVEYVHQSTIPGVFAAVATGRADCGIVPIENSTEGPVNATIDALAETPLRIISEIYLPIRLALLGRGEIASVRRVYSHAQPLAQARVYLAEHLPAAEVHETVNTAEGRDVEVLARDIEDASDNETRFFVVAKEPAGRTGRDKTTMIVSIKDEVGALHSMLSSFRDKGVNLTNLQSRPSRRRAWDYLFFIDCEGHIEDAPVAAAVGELESKSRHVQVLGSYPALGRAPAEPDASGPAAKRG